VVFDCHEELVALAAAAGATRRIGLVTTVLIGPVREPVLLAKQAATLDSVSGGRFTLGLGVGWRDDDFLATGTDFHRRGERLEEQIATLRRVWSGEQFSERVGAVGPHPARKGGPELVVGGTAPAALERAGRLADGFLAPPSPPGEVEKMIQVVRQARRRAGLPGEPRVLGAGYFALGDDVREDALANMTAYYSAGGREFVEVMTKGLLTTPERVRAAIASLEGIGVDEMFLWPASEEPSQVDRLAEIAL
jgi:alkanesulfonate monooxygenase SsuD/methylene tetrahydromethanopterin reductase-like flavin-dependent oxidoreductase (luciferase family)